MTQDYAYEIRFVDDDKVQVFDLARRHVDPTSATLPTEYRADEVLRGDLRYSKLLGTQQPVTEEQWEHVTYTKRGRRSIQRHTFMMGSHSTEHDTIMDLEVGNKDIADIRFNENNVHQNNSNNNNINNNINITEDDNSFLSSQPTSLDSTVTEPIENSPDHNQSNHFEFEREADRTNLNKKPSHSLHENAIKSVSSRSIDNNIITDSYLNNNTQMNFVKERNQYQSIESGYSIDEQNEKMKSTFPPNYSGDNTDILNNLNGKIESQQNYIEYENDRMTEENSMQYKNEHVSKLNREPDSNYAPVQIQQLHHQKTYQNERYYYSQHNHQYQMNQAQSKLDTQNSYSPQYTHIIAPTAAVTSNKKSSFYSTNMPMTNESESGALTRVKSAPLENYEASPERSCCIIS